MRESTPFRTRTSSLLPNFIAAAVFLFTSLAATAQISLSTAVDLAEKSSPAVHAAAANLQKSEAALAETKDAYIPSFSLGASPGYAYGFPFGYPSLFSATSQSLMLSFPQRDYSRAARAGVNSATLNLKDVQQQVALDVSQSYVELDYDLREIAVLDEENGYAGTLVQIEQDRVQAGVDPRVTELQAELTAAQVEQKRIHLEGDAEAMRQKIAHLTGLPPTGLTTVSASIPSAPTAETLANPGEEASNSPGVAAAFANAKSKLYSSFGDSRQNYRPLITFGAQYSLFEKFADYTKYFPTGFQYNNVAIGVVVTFPLFDATRRAKARESAADAVHAQADADAALDVLNEQRSTMRQTLLELGAQQRVAQVQSELAQEQLKTIETELTNGTGAPNSPQLSPSEAQKAHIEERERYADVLDTNFSLMKVELNLLRATGQMDAWVRASLK
ncbi:MAG: TolC family protein [Acidobacteriaceae bacterium]